MTYLCAALLAEGLGDAAHELKDYKKMEGGGESSGKLGGSKELSADDEEVGRKQCACDMSQQSLGKSDGQLVGSKKLFVDDEEVIRTVDSV